MTRATLLALADRVEALTGPCRETDAEIALAFGMYDRPEDLGCFVDLARAVVGGGGQTWAPPGYTASLDAAMTLVPDAAFWHVGHDGEGADPSIIYARVIVFSGLTQRNGRARALTPALALTAAALRARSAA